MTKLIITGSQGRMGQALLACAARIPELEVAGAVDKNDDLAQVIGQADVLIDFSFHSATLGIAELCARHNKAVVIGTTGHSADEKAKIVALQTQIPMVMATNFSTGVNTLFWLTRKAAEILAEVRQLQLAEALRHGRHGIVGERTRNEIGIHAIRGGDVVGDHTVIFANAGERVELTHKASSRDTFANGALRAAQWLVQQKPGLYDMQDVLGLK